MLQIVYVVFWGATVVGTSIYVYIHGEEFVDIPHLANK
jgi:hypothetical protein